MDKSLSRVSNWQAWFKRNDRQRVCNIQIKTLNCWAGSLSARIGSLQRARP